jgi:hypothetical protein
LCHDGGRPQGVFADGGRKFAAGGKMTMGKMLRGWKEIGAHLGGITDRHARRIASAQGLPVHKLPGARNSSVMIDETALRKWLQRRFM